MDQDGDRVGSWLLLCFLEIFVEREGENREGSREEDCLLRRKTNREGGGWVSAIQRERRCLRDKRLD